MQTSIKDVAKCLMSRKAMLDFVEQLCELHKFNLFVRMLGCVCVCPCMFVLSMYYVDIEYELQIFVGHWY